MCYNFGTEYVTILALSVLQFCVPTFKFDASGEWSGGAGVGSGSYPSLERENLHIFTTVA